MGKSAEGKEKYKNTFMLQSGVRNVTFGKKNGKTQIIIEIQKYPDKELLTEEYSIYVQDNRIVLEPLHAGYEVEYWGGEEWNLGL